MRLRTLTTLLIGAGLAVGCVATTPVTYRGTVTVTAETPDLVTIAPGVSVIADYDEPIFFAEGFYWWYVDGAWYRSTFYTGGWVIATPPVRIVRIDRVHAYRHYRPAGYVERRRPVPVHRVQRPTVRDHRRAHR